MLTESLIVFFAATVHGALGLGFPMTVTPLLAWQGNLMRAIQLTLFPTVGVNILMIISQSQPWQAIRPLIFILPAVVIGTIAGSMLIVYFNADVFRILLALLILVFLWLDHKKRIGITNPSAKPRGVIVIGLITGLLVGVVNAGVPALIIFALYNQLGRGQSIVLFNSCFLMGKITQFVLFGSLGELNTEWQLSGFLLMLIAVVGVLLGQWLGKRLDQSRWRAAMRWVLLFIALSLLFKIFTEGQLSLFKSNS